MSAVTIASQAATAISAAKAAKRQTKAIRQQMQVAAEETKREASADLFDQMRATRREQGRIRTAAGEAGLSLTSGSVEAMLMDSAMQGELRGDRTIANMEARHRANTAEGESMLSQVQKPTLLGAGLQIAGSALQGYSTAKAAKIKRS